MSEPKTKLPELKWRDLQGNRVDPADVANSFEWPGATYEVIAPDYQAAFGNLARLVTQAATTNDDAVRDNALQRCQDLIERVYSNPIVRRQPD